jgi:uncharacterized protein YqjF (DUF2071 family)
MKRQKPFLTAEWNNLLMLNYAVDSSLLNSFVPRGTMLDTFEGRTYLSLVGFQFNRTRMCGVAVPFHQGFEEVNLRFYVRRPSKRGVVFIRELVPKYAVALIARFAFNENYSCVPMSHRIEPGPDGGIAKVEYSWRAGSERCVMRIETEGQSALPPEGSASQFITEHYWGYAAQPGGGCLEYEVQHPRWSVWQARQASFFGNAAGLYGPEIAGILANKPDSAFLAKGSPVTVFNGTRIGGPASP